MSSACCDRPELERLLDNVREVDAVVVTRLDRLVRSPRNLLDIAGRLRDVNAGLRSLVESWTNTTSPTGPLVLTVFASADTGHGSVVDGSSAAAPNHLPLGQGSVFSPSASSRYR